MRRRGRDRPTSQPLHGAEATGQEDRDVEARDDLGADCGVVRTAGPTEFWDQGGWSTGVEQHEIRTDRRGLGLLERLRPTNVHDIGGC